MSDLDTSFAKLFERQPSDASRQRLYQVKDALGLEDNDALWLVLMALQSYQDLYEEIPGEIKAVVADVLGNVNETAKAAMQTAAEAAKADLAAAVATTANQVARDTAVKQKMEWIVCAVVSVAVCFFAVFFLTEQRAYDTGYAKGHSVGYRESKDEKAAAAWANTPEGKLAYRLAQVGDLRRLVHCDNTGWVKKDRVCFPQKSANGSLYGWRVP